MIPLSRVVLYINHRVWVNTCYACLRTQFPNRKLHSEKDQLPDCNAAVCYLSGSDPETLKLMMRDFKMYENFVSEDEEIEFLKEIDPILKRRRYEFDHWDGAIQGYKETEKLDWNEKNSKVLERLRKLAFSENTMPIKKVHVLDLAKTGHIKPHIDSIRFCGDTIAGISLLSSSIMRFILERNKSVVDCLLPRRSLYVIKGTVRYDFSHEILGETVSYFKGKFIARDRRVSVICRNEPKCES